MLLSELLTKLTCGDLEGAELDEAVAAITAAPSAPRDEWIDSDAQACTVAILLHLASHMASSDKLDELHEQIQDMFEEFPDFPYEMLEDSGGSALPYFEWLDTELAQRAVEDGGYELIQIDGNGTDEMEVLVVYRRDTTDIIQAAALMGVAIGRPLTYYRGIDAMVGKRPG